MQINGLLKFPYQLMNESVYVYKDFRSVGLVLLYMTKDEITKNWAGSILGKYWNLLYPLLFLGMYAVTYVVILKVRVGEMAGVEYTMMIFCGLVPYFGFAESLRSGVTSLSRNSTILKDIVFPVEMLPVRDVLVALWGMLFSLGWLLLGLLAFGKLNIYAFFVIPAVLLQLIFSIGIVWFLSVLAVFIRDIAHVVNIVILFLLFISPFAYTPDMVPDRLRLILYVNPMYYLTELYRQPLFYGRPPDVHVIFIFGGISVLLFLAGHFFIRRLKGVVVDYV